MQTATKPVAEVETRWESVSVWMDGEALEHTAELSTQAGSRVWDTYHLIGDVLRNPDLALAPSAAFHARLTQALNAELPIVAPIALSARRRAPLRVGLSSLAVAAAVATVAWVAQPYFLTDGSSTTAPQVVAEAKPGPVDDPAVNNYLEAHRQMAGPNVVRQVSFEIGVAR